MNNKKSAAFRTNILNALAGIGFAGLVLGITALAVVVFIKFMYPTVAEFIADDKADMAGTVFKAAAGIIALIFFGIMQQFSYSFCRDFLNGLEFKSNAGVRIPLFIFAIPLFLVFASMTPFADIGSFIIRRKLLWKGAVVAGIILLFGILAFIGKLILILK